MSGCESNFIISFSEVAFFGEANKARKSQIPRGNQWHPALKEKIREKLATQFTLQMRQPKYIPVGALTSIRLRFLLSGSIHCRPRNEALHPGHGNEKGGKSTEAGIFFRFLAEKILIVIMAHCFVLHYTWDEICTWGRLGLHVFIAAL